MRILVSGDREYKHGRMVKAVLDGVYREWFQAGFPRTLNEEFVVIHGAATGADTFADEAAKNMMDVQIEEYPAKWTEHDREGNSPIPCRCPEDVVRCKPAGPRRNRVMFNEGNPDLVLCFHDNFEKSKGTKDMASVSKAAGVPTYLISRL